MLAMSHPRKLVSVLYKYLYCTVLFRTVLYKNEKICPRQRTRNVSKTEVHSTRELANKYVRIVQYTIVQYNTLQYITVLYCIKMRKFAHDKE